MASMDYENENGARSYEGQSSNFTNSLNRLALRPRARSISESDNLFVDEAPRYERDRSASPRPTRRNESPRGGGGRRSTSPGGNGHMDPRSVHCLILTILHAL